MSTLNEMIATGDIIQVRDYLRLPYKEREDGMPQGKIDPILKGAKKTKTITKSK